jgi:predicted nucleotidyltransferase
LSSSVLRWPDGAAVHKAAALWAAEQGRCRREILRIGYFGSYARGDWGVGSDLDIVMIVERSALPFEQRPLAYAVPHLPVPVDLLIYTAEEWAALAASPNHFHRALEAKSIWLYNR